MFFPSQIRYNPLNATLPKNTMSTFEDIFRDRVDSILKRGKAVGLSVTAICKKTGIARATPDRWHKEVPLSVKLIDRMEEEVAKAELAAGK